MKKIIKISESQMNSVFNLVESAGVNDTMFAVADKIARQVSFNDIFEILSDIRLIENWHEEYDETYNNSVEYDNEIYRYYIYYEPMSENGVRKGGDDGNCVEVNFYEIEGVIAEYNEMDRILSYSSMFSFNEDDDEFDAQEYSKTALEGCPGVEYDIYKKIYPIILHELTHTLNKNSSPIERLFIKPTNRYTEEDVRDFMYTFSFDEMNARVSSAAAILNSIIKLEYSKKDLQDAIEYGAENYFFREIMSKVMNNNEIKYHHMDTLVKMLESNSLHFPTSREYLQSCMNKPTTAVYSLAYQLAINEDGLYKRKNPRKVLRMYASNPEKFEQKVTDFYRNLLEQYKRRIYKVCWHAFTNYSWDVGEMDDEYERNTKSWHNKIWGEDQ